MSFFGEIINNNIDSEQKCFDFTVNNKTKKIMNSHKYRHL